MTTATNSVGTGRALFRATLIGTVLQLAMVVSGHYDRSIAQGFAVGGLLLSLLAGFLFGRAAGISSKGAAAVGGLIAGGVCALIGIVESFYLGDVPAAVIAFGTAGSAVTGAIGGVLGKLTRRG